VWSSANGGTAGAALSTFILWILGVTVWGAESDADSALDAVTSVPGPVAGVVLLGLTYGGAMAAGWVAKHSPRPVELAEVDPLPAALEDSMVISNTPAADRDADGNGRDDFNGRFV
jgi:hypothetical protein